MSYGRAYVKGQHVKADKEMWSKVPTLGTCTIDCEVLTDSNAAQTVVFLQPLDMENGDAKFAPKDRVTP